MGFELKITGNDAAELAQSAITFAFLLAPNLRTQMQGTETRIEAPAVDAETVEPVKKPTRKVKAAETIEHDAKETKEDVRADDAAGNAEAVAEGGAVTDETADGDEESGKADEAAAAPKAEAAPEMSVDELRKFVINDYLNTCYETQQERSPAFKALLKPFGLEKLGDLPAEKIGEFKAAVDARIAEKLAA